MVVAAIGEWLGIETDGQLDDGVKGHVAPDVWQDTLLHVEEHEGLEGVRVDQIRVLLVKAQLAVDQFERLHGEARLLDRVDGSSIDHVLRGPFEELYPLDVILQTLVRQDHSLHMHLCFLDLLSNFAHCGLASRVLAFDRHDHPIIEDVKHLEGLTRDFMED